MEIQIITKQDLHDFRFQLLDDLKQIIQTQTPQPQQWLRSGETRKLLNISAGTLHNMRVNGTLKYKRVGSLIYYDYHHLQKAMQQ